MTIEIQRADTRLRRITVSVLVFAVAAAAAFLYFARRWLVERAIASSIEGLVMQMRQWIGITVVLIAACLLVLAIHALRRARAAVAGQRWPVAGTRVLRDTPVRHGEAALRIARLLKLLSLLLFLFAAATFAVSWRLFGV
ncbi:hypothetical protein [Dokdonella fugitiva]|jgi:hypothetical protein|uniref:Uncharacterized protein n=1 Tax=Dokdonella fugitiva TaxID=328517 RepID=A0A4R2IAI8_9GAMM|nr:hypothetical protein [Dokdonella fugitiva]MBA8883372.1 hypothetical protein [Dokdonella fugitiva]TCO40689.1 hypothetical protein EV148_10450 [Dokdonella fugitiva]